MGGGEESGAENLCRSPKPPNVIMSCFSAVSLSVILSLLYIEIYHPQFQFNKNLCSMKEYVREITSKCTVQISIGGTVSESSREAHLPRKVVHSPSLLGNA